jgi:hypothetical protein
LAGCIDNGLRNHGPAAACNLRNIGLPARPAESVKQLLLHLRDGTNRRQSLSCMSGGSLRLIRPRCKRSGILPGTRRDLLRLRSPFLQRASDLFGPAGILSGLLQAQLLPRHLAGSL